MRLAGMRTSSVLLGFCAGKGLLLPAAMTRGKRLTETFRSVTMQEQNWSLLDSTFSRLLISEVPNKAGTTLQGTEQVFQTITQDQGQSPFKKNFFFFTLMPNSTAAMNSPYKRLV